MITLLSPAKTLDFEEASKFADRLTDHAFPKETMRLVRLLKKKKVEEIQNLMSISEKLAALNVERYKSFKKDYSEGTSKGAIEAFKGDVYIGLDYETLSESDINYAQNHVRILSGLYGILKPLDRMQPYRLEMGTRLENKAGTNLYQFWGKSISKVLNKELAETSQNIVVNLASNEYFKAVDKKTLKARVIEANFKEERDGELKFISFNAKKARGMMARYIIKNKVDHVEELKGFDYDGYYYDETRSTPESLLFIR